VRVVHDLSDGGLALAAAEMALASDQGVVLDIDPAQALSLLFGEDQGRYLIAVADPGAIAAQATRAGVPLARIGKAVGADVAATGLFRLPLATLRAAHEAWMPAYMEAAADA
jgi:phosphoribosylformylglycinamidine (FGAM) synthase-like enzyme